MRDTYLRECFCSAGVRIASIGEVVLRVRD